VWSKAGRNVEGLHAVGDIFTKISVNCVLNYMLHYYLCVYFYGFFLCVFGYFLYMLHVYVYCYFSVNPCIYIMYLSVMFLYIMLPQVFCVHIF
jgi:hypothetical protein